MNFIESAEFTGFAVKIDKNAAKSTNFLKFDIVFPCRVEYAAILEEDMSGRQVKLSPARQVKLEIAQRDNLPIVLAMPAGSTTSLSEVFGHGAVDLSSSCVPNRLVWERPPRKNGRIYAHIQTKDWAEFEEKLKSLIRSKDTGRLLIACEDHIKRFDQLSFADPEVIKRSLSSNIFNKNARGHAGAGEALSVSEELSIAFPRIILNSKLEPTVFFPYVKRGQDDLRAVYVYTPDQKEQPEAYTDHYDQICNER